MGVWDGDFAALGGLLLVGILALLRQEWLDVSKAKKFGKISSYLVLVNCEVKELKFVNCGTVCVYNF